MTISKRNVVMTIAAAILLTIVFFFSGKVNANPSYFFYNSTNSVTSLSQTATTSVTWQTGGAGTTTVALNGALGSSQALDSAKLVLYRNASGPTSATVISFEFSPNCSATYPEWFPNKIDFGATTTPNIAGFTLGNQIAWGYATTTVGGLRETGNTNMQDKITLDVPTPTNCVRAVLTVPTGAASSSIWGMMIGKRQAP